MIAAVTGGTGFIGRHLVSTLVQQNIHVRLLTRRPDTLQHLWPKNKVEFWVGDVTRPETLQGFAKDAQVVFHLAGEIRDSARFVMVNETGTKNVLEACRDQKLKRFVYLSSVGVIGANGCGIVNESTPCHPKNKYERSKYAGERLVLASFKKYQMPIAVIRPTIVFGEKAHRDRDSLAIWLTAIKKGWFRFIGTEDSVANYVYVGDVARACLLVAENKKATGEIFIVADSCSMRDFVGAAAELLRVKMPGKMPTWLAYILAIGFEAVGRVAHFQPPLTVSRVSALTSRVEYKSDKIRKGLGFTPKIGWREGLRRTVAWYKREKMIAAH